MSDFVCSSSRSRFTIEDLRRISTNNGTAQRQESFPGPHYRIRDLKRKVTFSVHPQKRIWSRFPNFVFFALENPCCGARNQNLLKWHLISKRVYRFWAKPVQNLSPFSHYKVLDGAEIPDYSNFAVANPLSETWFFECHDPLHWSCDYLLASSPLSLVSGINTFDLSSNKGQESLYAVESSRYIRNFVSQ